jgi:hypothetical protein
LSKYIIITEHLFANAGRIEQAAIIYNNSRRLPLLCLVVCRLLLLPKGSSDRGFETNQGTGGKDNGMVEKVLEG